MRCEYCGRKNSVDASICEGCGAVLPIGKKDPSFQRPIPPFGRTPPIATKKISGCVISIIVFFVFITIILPALGVFTGSILRMTKSNSSSSSSSIINTNIKIPPTPSPSISAFAYASANEEKLRGKSVYFTGKVRNSGYFDGIGYCFIVTHEGGNTQWAVCIRNPDDVPVDQELDPDKVGNIEYATVRFFGKLEPEKQAITKKGTIYDHVLMLDHLEVIEKDQTDKQYLPADFYTTFYFPNRAIDEMEYHIPSSYRNYEYNKTDTQVISTDMANLYDMRVKITADKYNSKQNFAKEYDCVLQALEFISAFRERSAILDKGIRTYIFDFNNGKKDTFSVAIKNGEDSATVSNANGEVVMQLTSTEAKDLKYITERAAYVSTCKVYPYEEGNDRTPNYLFKHATFTGKIVSINVIERSNDIRAEIVMNVTKTASGYRDSIYVIYEHSESLQDPKVGEIITVHGYIGFRTEVDGIQMPHLEAAFVDLDAN